jgi:mediator of RNA polymerase II transcription subunit 8
LLFYTGPPYLLACYKSHIGSSTSKHELTICQFHRDSLQLSASILAQNLKSITEHLKSHSELFEKMVTYPSTNFPGRTQEGLLVQLLRKKLEPGVERWVEEGRAMALSTSQAGNGQGEQEDDLEEKWKEARDFIGERIARAAVTHRRDEYTTEEREMGIENVNTGLRRPMKLGVDEDGESDEGESEDEEMEDVEVVRDVAGGLKLEIGTEQKGTNNGGKVRSLDEIVRFMTTGLAPEDEVQMGSMAFRR